MGGTIDYRMATIGSVLKRSLDDRGGEPLLTLDPAFQGLPDTAHGGSVLAAFDALAGIGGPRAVSGVYRKRVPLGVPLALAHAREAEAHAFVLRDADGSVLVDGRVAATAADAGPHAAASARDGHPLPVSRACFACGTENPLGLRVRLAFDDRAVWSAWTPRAPFREPDGALAPAALTTLLDETAFWLGALATGESGMTTDLAVTLHGPVPFGAALTVSGRRATVRPHADDRRYWDTEVAARDAAGALVASARITFVAVRGAARRLVTGMLAINDADVVRRVFPAYARARA
ncbi:MAG: hypothetical protein A3I14_15545 [Candidatus Rokubacteria bacterium RIFCSPLOWO2_02_FULL_73_56]|nr:MAG: hypothetical protein A3D33_14085 [Candidatus Rokubacteria bacterium RIFCSPHIGHO2_02_FULL_73_26]OGL08659.1 MAG: hypothetical protein A3I14_15545 [Candidatus Rokubacteria bacterium RIFCSPLOWO2_02_FULL_73_56]